MNKILLTIASAAVIVIGTGVISSPASAFLDQNCNGRSSCSETDNSTVNQGGAGGDGGSATQGQAQGIFGSGNSENDNYNRNTNFNTNLNTNKQDQDQKQGQAQGQLQGQGQGQVQGNIGLGSGNVTNVTIEGDDAADIPVSSAHSAALTSSNDTCMGSTSAGVQAMGFGASLGSTWRDEDCVRRKDARALFNMGLRTAALARMCQKDDNRAAIEASGVMCPGTEEGATPVAAAAANYTVAKVVEKSHAERMRERRENRD